MGGFYIPFENMHPGVYWLSYASFARYGYSSLIINEYEGRVVPCTPEDAASFPSCPVPGDAVISGIGIYGVSENFWFNIGMVAVLQIIFRFAAYVLLRRN